MEIDKIKEQWKEEGKLLSGNIFINNGVSFQKLRSSFWRIRAWRFVRIVQWCIIMPLFFVFIILPNMKNDGSGLFYIALVVFILIMLSFCVSYVYHYIQLSKIDFTESISETQKKISKLEILDKRIYFFRFIFLLVAFLCAFKLFGTPDIKSEDIAILSLTVFLLAYVLFIRLRFLLPNEYTKIKSGIDQMERKE